MNKEDLQLTVIDDLIIKNADNLIVAYWSNPSFGFGQFICSKDTYEVIEDECTGQEFSQHMIELIKSKMASYETEKWERAFFTTIEELELRKYARYTNTTVEIVSDYIAIVSGTNANLVRFEDIILADGKSIEKY